MDRAQLVVAAHKTVETFAAITGRPLRLRNGRSPCTDGILIDAPFRHPSFYCLVEHELAHVLFLSDFGAKEAVVEDARAFAGKLTDAATVDAFSLLMAKLYSLLEDERVNSLWGELYPGSLAELRSLALRTMRRYRAKAHEDLVTWALCIGARVRRMPDGPFTTLGPALHTALEQVQQGAPESSLIATRGLMRPVWNHWVATWRASQKESSAQQRLDDLRRSARAPAGLEPETRRAISAARGVKLEDEEALNRVLHGSRERATERLEELRARLRKANQRSPSECWLRGTRDRTTLREANPKDLPPSPPLTPEDSMAVARLTQLFRRKRGKRQHRLSDEGMEVDVLAVIDRRLSERPTPIFREEVLGRGFRALLLVDRSSSMEGEPTKRVERATRILRRALEAAGVAFETWCFRSNRLTAVIERVPESHDLQESEAYPVDGQTPLHVGVAVAVQRLREAREQGHLFILTDGEPTFMGAIKMKTSLLNLKDQVREEIRRARAHGVGVSCLVVGDEIDDDDAFRMFGPRRHWHRTSIGHLNGELTRWISRSTLQPR